MECIKCGKEIADGSAYCNYCGRKQQVERRKRTRGNGAGTVYKKENGKYRAVVTLGYWCDETGKRHRKIVSATFDKKKDALEALSTLRGGQQSRTAYTFQQIYERFYETHKADHSKSTMDCYKAAFNHFRDIWFMPMADINIDDLQECVDGCGHGRRTKENMKALAGLMYKYAIPRNVIPNNLNLAQFIRTSGERAAEREAFDDIQIEKIRQAVDKGVPYADYVYCLIYLGFRPSEFLSVDVKSYDSAEQVIRGGSKTKAGTNRLVTIPKRIQPIVQSIAAGRTEGALFCAKGTGDTWTLKTFSENAFYPVLEAAGIDNPIVEIANGVKRHRYSPHSCRHTYATLLKRIDAPAKDKQRLIGHNSEEMLMYYQDVALNDLRRITDNL